MKNDESHTLVPVTASTTTCYSTVEEESSGVGVFSRNRYKIWVLIAILVLAFWSLFTVSVTLYRSSGDSVHFSDQLQFHIPEDLDVLELESREKLVLRLWNVYAHGNINVHKLPRFWRQAFGAAYEYLTSDDSGTRDVAVLEIAKMSMRSANIEPLLDGRQKTKAANESKERGGFSCWD